MNKPIKGLTGELLERAGGHMEVSGSFSWLGRSRGTFEFYFERKGATIP